MTRTLSQLVRDLTFCISLIVGLMACGVVFKVASGASFDAYPLDRLILIPVVGGPMATLGLFLIGSRRQ